MSAGHFCDELVGFFSLGQYVCLLEQYSSLLDASFSLIFAARLHDSLTQYMNQSLFEGSDGTHFHGDCDTGECKMWR